jgi:hypothetical protein
VTPSIGEAKRSPQPCLCAHSAVSDTKGLRSYGGWFVAKVIEVENQSRVKIHFHGGTMHTLKQLSHRIYVATEFAPNVLLTRLGGKVRRMGAPVVSLLLSYLAIVSHNGCNPVIHYV